MVELPAHTIVADDSRNTLAKTIVLSQLEIDVAVGAVEETLVYPTFAVFQPHIRRVCAN